MTDLVRSELVNINGILVEEISYKYFSHEIRINRDHQTQELMKRIGLHGPHYKTEGIYLSQIFQSVKKERVLNCGAETLTLTKKLVQKLKIAQFAMKGLLFGITFRDCITNIELRRRTKLIESRVSCKLESRANIL